MHDEFLFVLHLSHSVSAVEKNQELEFERNKERFLFLKVATVLYVCITFISA